MKNMAPALLGTQSNQEDEITTEQGSQSGCADTDGGAVAIPAWVESRRATWRRRPRVGLSVVAGIWRGGKGGRHMVRTELVQGSG